MPRVPKCIKEGLKTKPKSVGTDLDHTLPGKLWFQMHLKSVHPVHNFPPIPDGSQINVVGGKYYHRKAGGYDCGVVDHYVNERKTGWLKIHVTIGNAAEHTYFKWDKLCFILDSVMAPDAIFYIFKFDSQQQTKAEY